MGGQGHHSGRIAAIIRLLAAVAVLGIPLLHGPSALASASEAKSPAKLLGFTDPDTLDHFQLLPFNISVIRDGRVARIVTLVVTLETKGDANKTKVMNERYRLQDAFLRDMQGVAPYQRADSDGLDPQMLKTRLRIISDRMLGQDVVNNVLVQSIFDRILP